MRIKTSKDLKSSLRGSAFRRATCDSRNWFVRAIRTVGTLQRGGPAGNGAAPVPRVVVPLPPAVPQPRRRKLP